MNFCLTARQFSHVGRTAAQNVYIARNCPQLASYFHSAVSGSSPNSGAEGDNQRKRFHTVKGDVHTKLKERKKVTICEVVKAFLKLVLSCQRKRTHTTQEGNYPIQSRNNEPNIMSYVRDKTRGYYSSCCSKGSKCCRTICGTTNAPKTLNIHCK